MKINDKTEQLKKKEDEVNRKLNERNIKEH